MNLLYCLSKIFIAKTISDTIIIGSNKNVTILYSRGVEKLSSAPVYSTDLRAGAALVIAGLSAQGVTKIGNIHFIERGYEDMLGKLTALGAQIRRIEE